MNTYIIMWQFCCGMDMHSTTDRKQAEEWFHLIVNGTWGALPSEFGSIEDNGWGAVRLIEVDYMQNVRVLQEKG